MDPEHSLKQLKQALHVHHQALEQLESALVEFEQSISREATLRPQQEERRGLQLLSIPQLCQELGMGKSTPQVGDMPVIALSTAVEENLPEEERILRVPWPCETKVLVERIEAALLGVPAASRASTGARAWAS